MILDNVNIPYRYFSEKRSIEQIMFKLSPRDKYIIDRYIYEMGIENRTTWLLRLINREISSAYEAGFFELSNNDKSFLEFKNTK